MNSEKKKPAMDNVFLSNDDWIPNGAFDLDSFLSMETDDLLNTANFDTQPDLIENMLNFCDPPMFNDGDDEIKDEPMFSSSASDSGLSSDNLDLDVQHDLDLFNSCSASPVSIYTKKPQITAEEKEIAPLKRSIRNNRNTNSYARFGSLRNTTNSNNNINNEKGEQKLIQIKNSNGKSAKCSIIVPVTSQNMKDFRSIKIVNSGFSQLKSANIKAVAANLLKKSKQGLLQKNIFTKQEMELEDTADEDDDLNFDQIMQETDAVLGAHDEDDDLSSAESCGPGYPKLVLTNEEKRLLSKEGIQLPQSYPLTKHEERELKRIRRKIRNKISAQDSRKRKKEYIDGLEERVKQCSDENMNLIKRIKVLQTQNHDLMSKMKKLQTLLSKSTGKTAQPATCLMILLLSMALVTLPNLKLSKEAIYTNDLTIAFGDHQNRRNLLFDLKSELEDLEPDDTSMYIPNEHDYVESVYKYVSQLSSEIPPSAPLAKKAKMLVDYDIDSIDKWELKKRSDSGKNGGGQEHHQMPKITVSKDLFDIGSKVNKTSEIKLSDADNLLAREFINLAAVAATL